MSGIHLKRCRIPDTVSGKTCQMAHKPHIKDNSLCALEDFLSSGAFIGFYVSRAYFHIKVLVISISGARVAIGRLERIGFDRYENQSFTGLMTAWTHFWMASLLGAPFRIGNKGMVRPATSLSAVVKHNAFGRRPDGGSSLPEAFASRASLKSMISKFPRHHRRPGSGRPTSRAAVAGLPLGSSRCHSVFSSPHSPFQPLRDAPACLQSRTLESGLRTLAGGPGRSCVAPKRVSHAQQNAHRFISPRRNKSCRPSR
jgi:hypothetical protein